MFKLFFIDKIPIKRGKEAVMVYKIRYIPACNRSGWFPDLVIKRSVGTRITSNII